MTCHYEEKEKDIWITSYTVTAKSKGKKNVVIPSTMRPMDACTKDDDKFKLQIPYPGKLRRGKVTKFWLSDE